jgi:hypothetical protein
MVYNNSIYQLRSGRICPVSNYADDSCPIFQLSDTTAPR